MVPVRLAQIAEERRDLFQSVMLLGLLDVIGEAEHF
jgi:hypothetical protein